jgi:hypothetical protein
VGGAVVVVVVDFTVVVGGAVVVVVVAFNVVVGRAVVVVVDVFTVVVAVVDLVVVRVVEVVVAGAVVGDGSLQNLPNPRDTSVTQFPAQQPSHGTCGSPGAPLQRFRSGVQEPVEPPPAA